VRQAKKISARQNLLPVSTNEGAADNDPDEADVLLDSHFMSQSAGLGLV
jgi:hypothetical protein